MLGITHKRIAREIAEELELGEREASLLESGSVSPDSWENFPHHTRKGEEITQNILRSRVLFLEGDDECYHKLGVALHYIQDKWTLRPRLKDKHTSWEVHINSASIVDNPALEEVIKSALLPTKAEKACISFLNEIAEGIKMVDGKILIFALLDRPTTYSTPILDLNFAYRISLEISRSVLSRPDENTRQSSDLLSKHQKELDVTQSRINGFPEAYLEAEWNIVRVRDKVNIDRTRYLNHKDIEARFRKEFSSVSLYVHRDKITPVYSKDYETIFDETEVKKRHWLFKNKKIVKKERIPK